MSFPGVWDISMGPLNVKRSQQQLYGDKWYIIRNGEVTPWIRYGLQITTRLLVRPGKKVIHLWDTSTTKSMGANPNPPFPTFISDENVVTYGLRFLGETSFYLSTSVKQESATPFPCSTSSKEMQPYIQTNKNNKPATNKNHRRSSSITHHPTKWSGPP